MARISTPSASILTTIAALAVSTRTPSRGWVQRHLLYLGEINDSQKAAWTKVTEVFDPVRQQTRGLALYPADRQVPVLHAADYGVQVRLDQFELRRPRQWGACWVGLPPGGSVEDGCSFGATGCRIRERELAGVMCWRR